MRVIYDELTGHIYCVTDVVGEIKPKVFDIEIPQGKVFKNLIVNQGGEPLVEFEDLEDTGMEKRLKKLEEELENTKLALLEATVANTLTEEESED